MSALDRFNTRMVTRTRRTPTTRSALAGWLLPLVGAVLIALSQNPGGIN